MGHAVKNIALGRSSAQNIPTKKFLKELATAKPGSIFLEDTSIVQNGYTGLLMHAPDGKYDVVGPDAYKDRRWYATIEMQGGKVVVR